MPFVYTQKRTNIGNRIKKYEVETIDDKYILKREGKYALHLGHIGQIVELLHSKFGHMSSNAVRQILQANFKCENFENKVYERFSAQDCDFCLDKREFRIPKICKST